MTDDTPAGREPAHPAPEQTAQVPEPIVSTPAAPMTAVPATPTAEPASAAEESSPDAMLPAPTDSATPDPGPLGAAAAGAVIEAADGPRRRGAARFAGYLGAAILGVAVGALGLSIVTGGIGGASSPSPSASVVPSPSPRLAGNMVGTPDAPVTIEVWADYQCSFCRLEDLLFGGAVEREYVMAGIARVVYRDFAFLGQESVDAAVAGRCAGRQDPAAQLRYHDALYTFQQGVNQGRFGRDNLVQVAAIAGVPDAAAFVACLDDPAVARAVAEETTAGRNLGIDSTPTIRLEGPGGQRMVKGFSQAWPPLRDAIEAVREAPASPGPSVAPGASAAPSAPATP
jgi:protein-disulfide isomerase